MNFLLSPYSIRWFLSSGDRGLNSQKKVAQTLKLWLLCMFLEMKYVALEVALSIATINLPWCPHIFHRDRPKFKFVGMKDRLSRPRTSANSQPARWRTGAYYGSPPHKHLRHYTKNKKHRDHAMALPPPPPYHTQRHCHSSATAGPNPLKINDDKVHTSFYNSFYFQRRCFVFRSSRYYYVGIVSTAAHRVVWRWVGWRL